MIRIPSNVGEINSGQVGALTNRRTAAASIRTSTAGLARPVTTATSTDRKPM
jgi:hypothetical protein